MAQIIGTIEHNNKADVRVMLAYDPDRECITADGEPVDLDGCSDLKTEAAARETMRHLWGGEAWGLVEIPSTTDLIYTHKEDIQ